MVSHTVYFTCMVVFTLTSQMYHSISVLVPVLVRVPEYLSTSTSTSTSTMTLELMSTSTVLVPEIQYSSTVSTSTEYEYPSPGVNYTLIHFRNEQALQTVVTRVLFFLVFSLWESHMGSHTQQFPLLVFENISKLIAVSQSVRLKVNTSAYWRILQQDWFRTISLTYSMRRLFNWLWTQPIRDDATF